MRHPIRSSVFRLVWAMTVFLPLAPARATDYCVDTAAQLQAALNSAAASTTNDIIRLVQGTYHSTSPQGFRVELEAEGNLTISGGWFAGCLFPVRNSRSTIDGELARPGMVLLGTFDSGGTLRVERLNFINGRGTGEYISGGLTANPYLATNLEIEIENCRFANNTADHANLGMGGGLNSVADGPMRVRNNLFLLNHADVIAGAASLSCNGAVAGFVNNTVVDNTASVGAADDVGGVRIGGSGCTWEVANNILWGNEGQDLFLQADGAVLRYNDLDDLGGTSAPGSSSGNVNVNPQFVSENNLRLRRESPLVDAGLDEPFTGLPATAYDGGPRIAGPHVDIGAYELDVLFADDFDPLVIIGP
jgi:hypothetical protein